MMNKINENEDPFYNEDMNFENNDVPEYEISPSFIDRFNYAAKLSSDGQYGDSLYAYEHIFDPFDNTEETRIVTAEFLGIVILCKAYCHMDQNQYKEAEELLDSDEMKEYLHQFRFDDLFEYYFAFGNTLGELGKIREMDRALGLALEIAEKKLYRMDKCQNVWRWIMRWGKESENWQYLEDQCVMAHNFGVVNDDPFLQVQASLYGAYAFRGLGKIDKARHGAEANLQRMIDADAEEETINEWEDFIETLDE